MRTSTPVTLVKIVWQGVTGIGEAAMPPYLGESHHSAGLFLQKAAELRMNEQFDPFTFHLAVDGIAPGNTAAKAALDLAYHDLWGKILGMPLSVLLAVNGQQKASTFTVGIAVPELIRQKIREGLAAGFRQFKAKLGGSDDRAIILAIRQETNLPLFADVNQGWESAEKALEMIHWLKEHNVLFVEQPLKKDDHEGHHRLFEESPLPVFADESCQRLADVEKMAGLFHGINVKLMKCTGLHEALQMVKKARELQLQTMIGCMTETSCATLAGAAIAPLFDYTDLDGPWIIASQPFSTPVLQDGIIVNPGLPGIGYLPAE